MSEAWKSDDISDLAAALVEAQGELEAVPKAKEGKIEGTSKGGARYEYSYAYADLASCMEAVRKVFPNHGLCYVQRPEPCAPGFVRLTTVLMHTSGQWLSGTVEVPTGGSTDPKKTGAALSYSRRYGLCALCGLATEDDESKLPKGAARAAGTSEERSHLNRSIGDVMKRLGWSKEDGAGFFDSWKADHPKVQAESIADTTIAQLRKLLAAFENEEVRDSFPFSGGEPEAPKEGEAAEG